MNNILITGTTGYLGGILKDRFQEMGAFVFDLKKLCMSELRVDITQPIDFKNKLIPEVVIHAAGKAHSIPKTMKDEYEFFEVNLEGTKNLCFAIDKMKQKPKAFIFISSVAVYGLDKGYMIDESTPLNGKSPYAKSKIQAEEFLKKWATINNITLGILRLPLIVGKNPPGNLGFMINGIKTGRYLSIGKAEAKKSVIWANDIVNIIAAVAEVGGIYNLTDGYHPSFGELENKIAFLLNKKAPLKIPKFVAVFFAIIGNLIGDKFPINLIKLKKITSELTFNDYKARINLEWNPSIVLNKISEII